MTTTTAEVTYPAYELPQWQRQPLTQAQYDKLSSLCERYGVPFDPRDYVTLSVDSLWTPGFAEGWVGGNDFGGGRPTIFVGVAPNGDSHS